MDVELPKWSFPSNRLNQIGKGQVTVEETRRGPRVMSGVTTIAADGRYTQE